jgi:hypothetical protein
MSITVQTPEELRQNVAMFNRLLGETTKINLIPAQGMTQEQLKQCQHNAAAFDVRMASLYTQPDGRVDYSIQNIADTYKFLRDNNMLKFEVAPIIRKTVSVYQEELNRKNHARDKSKDPVPEKPKTLAEEQNNAEMRVAVNQGIERLRAEIASYTARTHSKTARARAEMTEVLNGVVNGRRHLYDVVMAEDQIKGIGAKYWDE